MIRHRQPRRSPQLGRPAGRERLTPGQLRALGRELGFPIYTAKAAAAAAASLAPTPRPEEGSPAERLRQVRQMRREFRIRTAPADPRFITAIHEAGHAVVGVRVGMRFRKASIVPSAEPDGRRVLGAAWFWDQGTANPADHLTMTLAGPAAETRYLGRPADPHFGAADFEDARKLLGVRNLEASPDYRQGAARAAALVAEHWDTIHRVASHLVASPVLTADALRPLLES